MSIDAHWLFFWKNYLLQRYKKEQYLGYHHSRIFAVADKDLAGKRKDSYPDKIGGTE